MAERFVWHVFPRQELLDDAMAELRGLPYEALRRIIKQPVKKKVKDRNQKVYYLTVTADWVGPDSQDFEITVRLKRKRWWFGKTLTDSFRVSGLPQSTDGREAD